MNFLRLSATVTADRALRSAVLGFLALMAVPATAEAQVPRGWAISAHVNTSSVGGSAGGLFLHDTTGTMPSVAVTGLPIPLSGFPFAGAGNNGANAVGILPDRTVVVGHVSAFGLPLELYHLGITVNPTMTTATATLLQPPIPLGTGAGGLRAQVAEIEVIGPTTVVIAVSTLSGTVLGGPGPLSGHFAGVVDVGAATVTPVNMTPTPPGVANAVASDGVDVWIGTFGNVGIWKVPIGGGTPTLIYTPTVQCNNLEIDGFGNLVLTLSNQHDTINPQTGALISTCNLAGGNAMAVDPKTQDWILVNVGRIERLAANCASLTVISPTPPGGWGNGSGIALSTPATFKTFGVGCPGSVGIPTLNAVSGSLPWIGQTFQVQLAGLPTGALNTPFIVLGLSNTLWGQLPLPLNLGQFGMFNCTLYVSADFSGPLVNNGGTATWSLPIPNNPFLVGLPIYVQGGVVDPSANPAGIVVTNAGEAILGTF